MKRICITYQMEKENEVAETCIVLPMTEIQAEQLFEDQSKFSYGIGKSHSVSQIIENLASLQGYEKARFICAEEV